MDHSTQPNGLSKTTASEEGLTVAGSLDRDRLADLPPSETFSALGFGDPDIPILAGSLPSDRLHQLTFAPVAEYRGSSLIQQNSARGYQPHTSTLETRRIAEALRSGDSSPLHSPVVLSGRGTWKWSPRGSDARLGTIRVFGPAAIIDGRKRIGAAGILATSGCQTKDIPFVVLPGLSLSEERLLFEATHGPRAGQKKGVISPPVQAIQRPATLGNDRLTITTEPVSVEILCEPYVVVNSFGYSPLVNVRDLSTNTVLGLFLSSKTLALGIEEQRPPAASIVGLRLAIAREGTERTSTYRVVPLTDRETLRSK